jgi:hypothetical protein
MHGAERVFYYLLYSSRNKNVSWVKKPIWKNAYNLFSWYVRCNKSIYFMIGS